MLAPKSLRPKGDYSLPLPATFAIKSMRNRHTWLYVVALIVMLFWLNPLGLSFSRRQTMSRYPPAHPLTSKHIITTSSRYIYPAIEHSPLLNELGVLKLVKESRVRDAKQPEVDASEIQSLNIFDDPDPKVQMAREKEENEASQLSLARNSFKNHDKVVYKPKNNNDYPDVVVVTAIDFAKYSQVALAHIVQNRVDYAHIHNYGVYVRWYQEFLPRLNAVAHLNDNEKLKWVRMYCVQAAQLAFPKAKWFWYLDEDGMIMDLSVDLHDYLLSEEALTPAILREKAVNPGSGLIKTYKNIKASAVRLIVVQSDLKLETTSFLLKNDDLGTIILEYWTSDLLFEYNNFPYGPDSALTHILQWHPTILSKTVIVPTRTISAMHKAEKIPENADDHLHYVKGDFVVTWSDCEKRGSCESILQNYQQLLHPEQDEKEAN